MKIKILIISGIIFLSSYSVFAQMDCRSMLGAHLTPFKKDGQVSWALEGTMAPGVMTSPYDSLDNTKLNGGMLIGALDFSFSKKKSHIYIEGGFKNWKNSDFVNDSKEKNSRHLGARQIFYSFTNDKIKIKAGLHETRLGDFFLIDERMLGVSVDKSINAFTVNFRAGTVNKSFARMGKFCANRHLYGLINNGNYTENIGKKVGETNLAGFVINWNPHYIKPKPSAENANNDEFSDASNDEFSNETTDEFHENHDFNEFGNSDEFSDESSDEKPKQKISLKNIGLIVYDEFGSSDYIPDNKLYTGVLFDVNLPYDFFLQTGGVYQNMLNQNTFVYIAKFGKSKLWNNSSLTKISGAYIGKADIDDNSTFQPLFSNLFIGEVMRMDAAQFPLWQAAIKHKFPGKRKIHIAAKFVGQIEDNKTNEQDVEVGLMLIKNHLKLTLIGSRVETLALPNDVKMVRLEARLAF